MLKADLSSPPPPPLPPLPLQSLTPTTPPAPASPAHPLAMPAASLQGPDLHIADALSAWLAALHVAPPNQPLHRAAAHCVALCHIFARVAPHLLTARDYFVPANVSGANASRQRRYNTRRLARSLADCFALAPRGPSPPRDTGLRDCSAAAATTAAAAPHPGVSLSDAAAANVSALAEAESTEELESPTVLLVLAECVLVAAVHGPGNEPFIDAVTSLPPQHQEHLVASVRRTAAEGPPRSALTPVKVNDENAPQSASDASPLPFKGPAWMHAHSYHREPAPDPLTTPKGIPLAEYKSLAGERDNLRRKLAAAEADRAKAVEDSDDLRASLEEAGDRIRELQKAQEDAQEEVANKAKALNDAKSALRDAHVSAEEIDVLRAKAASAEQLEASLKRASKRLEDVADMRRVNKELDAQLSAFRENEERIVKQTEYLEAQLTSSNQRGQELASLSDQLSANVEEKEKNLTIVKAENSELRDRLDTANKQLASMLIQSANSPSLKDGSTPTSQTEEWAPESAPEEAAVAAEVTTVVDITSEPPKFTEQVVTDHLFEEIGVRMSWNDIVECIRGVMDALREMDEEEGSSASRSSGLSMRRAQMSGIVSTEGDRLQASRASSIQQKIVARNEEEEPDDESDADSHTSVLPEFGELDSELAAAHGGFGDEFDFAANEVNVEEVPILQKRSSKLATIPENCEGFKEETCDSNHSSYISGYTSEDLAAAAREAAEEQANNRPAEQGSSHKSCEGSVVDSGDKDSDSSGRRRSSLHVPASPSSEGLADGKKVSVPNIEKHVQVANAYLDTRNVALASVGSLPSNVRRATSLTISVLGGLRKHASRSDSTRAMVRQARSELSALQHAMEAMRAERQSSASIGVLVQQLNDAREELRHAETIVSEKASENDDLRREVDALMKEFEAVTFQKEVNEQREERVLKEKERLVVVLKKSLEAKDQELKDLKQEFAKARQQVEQLQNSEAVLSEKLRASEVVGRAQEVEIARLSAKVEANEAIETRLKAVVQKTNGLDNQMTKQRESFMNDIAAEARREKQLAEEARDEARRVTKAHASVLEDVRATAAAVAMVRSQSVGILPSRKSTRFSGFWRRLMHRETTMDYSVPNSPAPAQRMSTSGCRKRTNS